MRRGCILLMLTLPAGTGWQTALCQQPAAVAPALGFAESDDEFGTAQDLGKLWQLTLANQPRAGLSAWRFRCLWDRKQGQIQTAQAHLAHAQAAVQSTANRLRRETSEALSRYHALRQQVDRLEHEVLPLLKKSFDLLEKSYQGGGQMSFSDLLMTEQSYFTTRLSLAAARQNLWLAIADVQGLMQQEVE